MIVHTRRISICFSVLVTSLAIAADDVVHVYNANGHVVLTNNQWWQAQTTTLQSNTCVLTVSAVDGGVLAGILAETSTGVVTDASWKCSMVYSWNWYYPWFDDSDWDNARVIGRNGDGTWPSTVSGISTQAEWIWADVISTIGTVYCRKTLC